MENSTNFNTTVETNEMCNKISNVLKGRKTRLWNKTSLLSKTGDVCGDRYSTPSLIQLQVFLYLGRFYMVLKTVNEFSSKA